MIRELTGRHVLFILIAMFGIVFAVNGVFAYLAIDAFPGVATQHAYRKGVSFNQQIAEAEALKALGWTLTAERDRPDRLTLKFRDKSGSPLAVDAVTASLYHPANAKGDRQLSVVRVSQGVFAAGLMAGVQGLRQLRVDAIGPDNRHIRFRHELWLD